MTGGKKFKNGLTLPWRESRIYARASLSLPSVHYNSPERLNWTVKSFDCFVLLCCLFNRDFVCFIFIGVVCSQVFLIVVLRVSTRAWEEGWTPSCESCEESHVTQSHNDWSAETTLFLTLVARCYSDAGPSKLMKNAFNFSE